MSPSWGLLRTYEGFTQKSRNAFPSCLSQQERGVDITCKRSRLTMSCDKISREAVSEDLVWQPQNLFGSKVKLQRQRQVENKERKSKAYAPPPTGVCIWWVGTVSTDAEDLGSWWSGRYAEPERFYKPPSQSLSPLLKRYNPPGWRRGSPRQTSSSGNSSLWPWGRGWSRSSPHWRSPSWSSWPGPPGRWCQRPHWRPARWWWSALRRRLFPQEWWLDSPSSWWALSSPSRTCNRERNESATGKGRKQIHTSELLQDNLWSIFLRLELAAAKQHCTLHPLHCALLSEFGTINMNNNTIKKYFINQTNSCSISLTQVGTILIDTLIKQLYKTEMDYCDHAWRPKKKTNEWTSTTCKGMYSCLVLSR